MEFTFANLLLVLLCAWVTGAFASRLGYPAILGELLAGIVFGPAILGVIEPQAGLKVLADVGVFLLMLYIGMEVHLRELAKSSGAAILASLGGFFVPFGLAMWFVMAQGYPQYAAMIVGVAAGVTSLAVGPRILVDLKLMNTRLASVLTTGALISDTIALLVFAGVMSAVDLGEVELAPLGLLVLKAVLFFGAATLIGLRAFPLLRRLLDKLQFKGRTAHFTVLLIVAFTFAELAELAGLHAIIGAFMAGLFLGEGGLGPRRLKELESLVHDLSIGFLAPVFFVQTGFHVDLGAIQNVPLLTVGIVLAATVGKTLGFMALYLPSGRGWREGLAIGAGMNGRGALDIVVAGIALEAGVIDGDLFSILVVLAIFSAFSVPVFVRWAVGWLKKRGELVEENRRSGILIIGAGAVSRVLALQIKDEEPVTLVDANPEHCREAAKLGLNVVDGNALTDEVLVRAGATTARQLLALTPNPQINLLVAQLGRESFLIPEIYLFLPAGDEERAHELLGRMGVGSFDLVDSELEDWDRWIVHEHAVPKEIVVAGDATPTAFATAAAADRPLLPLVAIQNGRRQFFFTVDELKEGDKVMALCRVDQALPTDDFDRQIEAAPILDLVGEQTQSACFDEVARSLADRVPLAPEELAHQLHERQRLDTTVLTQGLAVPHIRIEGEGLFELVVVRAREGIAMEPDDRRVYALFALVGTQDRRTMHLRTLSAIAQIVQDPDFESRWLEAPDTDALRRLLRNSERRRFNETFA